MLFSLLALAGRMFAGCRRGGYAGARLANSFWQSCRRRDAHHAMDASSHEATSPELVAVIACQRTGSHLLREVLNSNPQVAIWGEPFCDGSHHLCWLHYVRRLRSGRYPPLVSADATEVMDQYLRELRRNIREKSSLFGGPKPELKIFGLDVKYDHLGCIRPFYMDLLARPFLLDYLRDRKARILHLVRRNVVHNAISMLVALQRNVWQNWDGRTISGRYRIAPGELFHLVNWIRTTQAELGRLAHDLPLQTCAYEDVVGDLGRIDSDNNFPEDSTALRAVAEFLGVPNRFSYNQRPRKVINRPYCEVLENHDELVRALRDSEYAEFADSL